MSARVQHAVCTIVREEGRGGGDSREAGNGGPHRRRADECGRRGGGEFVLALLSLALLPPLHVSGLLLRLGQGGQLHVRLRPSSRRVASVWSVRAGRHLKPILAVLRRSHDTSLHQPSPFSPSLNAHPPCSGRCHTQGRCRCLYTPCVHPAGAQRCFWWPEPLGLLAPCARSAAN